MQAYGRQHGERHSGSGGLRGVQERECDGDQGGDAPELRRKRPWRFICALPRTS